MNVIWVYKTSKILLTSINALEKGDMTKIFENIKRNKSQKDFEKRDFYFICRETFLFVPDSDAINHQNVFATNWDYIKNWEGA